MSFNHRPPNSPPPKKKINLSKPCKPELSKPVLMPPPKPKMPDNVIIVDNPISPLLTGIFIGLLIGILILIGCGACGVFKTAS